MKPIHFFAQERPESCVPACLRMILASCGIERTETELYTCCECDEDGTLPSAAARCAQLLGFAASAARLTGIDALQEQISAGVIYPIVFVNLSSLLGLNVIHALVVEAIDKEAKHIQVIDPAFPPDGRRRWTLGLFDIGWQFTRRQTILIRAMTA